MRILRIQFENLNSLRSGDIDLERGPLAEAGSFAITGPTGAGKSTLLDALTLALYGRAARYENERNPENMMSRHTGMCRAEVLFEVPRGRFQARWELRRARGKPDGKLQPAKRTVVQDGSGTVLAEKIDEADRLIEELTGLDYERFRRSVLLAQGEFTRFLKAKPDERAELLESLTGTVIYSSLGELAYREATRREEELEMRRQTLGRVVLLAEEERAVKSAEIERLSGEIATLTERRNAAAKHVEQGRQLLVRLGEEAEISEKRTALAKETDQNAAALERLKTHRLAEPFLSELQTLDTLEHRAADEAIKSSEAEAAMKDARGELAAGLQAASAVASDVVKAAQSAIEKEEAAIQKLAGELAEVEAAQKEAEDAATHAAEKLAKLLKGRTTEEIATESANVEKKRAAITELHAAMEKRDNAATEAARLADEEASLVEEIELATQEKSVTLMEAEAQAVLLESARSNLEQQERIAGMEDQRIHLKEGESCPLCGALEHPFATPDAIPSAVVEEARRNWNAAKIASDTAAREARVASDVLTRTEERLAGVQKRRGEIRWQQTADHEKFEQLARSIRIFTPESLQESLEALDQSRAELEMRGREMRDAESNLHVSEKALLTQKGKVAQLHEKLTGQRNAMAGRLEQRDALARESAKLAASATGDTFADLTVNSDLAARFQAQWRILEEAGTALEQLRSTLTETAAKSAERRSNLVGVQKAATVQASELKKHIEGSVFADVAALRTARLDPKEAARVEALQSALEARRQALEGKIVQVREQVRGLLEAGAPEGEALKAAEADLLSVEREIATATEQRATLRNDLMRDDETRRSQSEQLAQLETDQRQLGVWSKLRQLIGSATGGVFRQFAQGLSLDLLVRHANQHLSRLSERYRLRRVEGGELTLEIVDRHQADATRPMQSLSGGESFLASLALALGLSDLAGRNVRIDSLFIDEGFGSLDPETLDVALSALDALRLCNKTVGIISHVELLKERIPVQIRVEKQTGGTSVLQLP